MALTYTGSGGLFTRLGVLIYMMDAVRAHQAGLAALYERERHSQQHFGAFAQPGVPHARGRLCGQRAREEAEEPVGCEEAGVASQPEQRGAHSGRLQGQQSPKAAQLQLQAPQVGGVRARHAALSQRTAQQPEGALLIAAVHKQRKPEQPRG